MAETAQCFGLRQQSASIPVQDKPELLASQSKGLRWLMPFAAPTRPMQELTYWQRIPEFGFHSGNEFPELFSYLRGYCLVA